jgi:hypothetical protein
MGLWGGSLFYHSRIPLTTRAHLGVRVHALPPQSWEIKKKICEAGCTCEHQPRLVTVLDEEVVTSTRSICDFCIFGSPPEP